MKTVGESMSLFKGSWKLAVALVVSLAACMSSLRAGWVEDVDGKTIIHVKLYDLPDPARTSTPNQASVAVVNAFKQRFSEIFAERWRERYKANPEIYGEHNWDQVEVKLEKFSGIQVEGVETDLLAIAGGMAPDVLYVNFRKSDTYIRNGFLYPLDEYVSQVPKDELAVRVNQKIWPVIRRKGPKGQEHVWAMPYGGALGMVLIYRKDIFDANKLPYPDASYTWDQMLADCRVLTDPAKGTYGIQLGRGKQESWYWMTYLWSAGGEAMVYNQDTDEWRCTFDSREAAVALDFYTRLSAEKWIDKSGAIRRGYSSKDASESGTKWERGEIGMKMAYVEEKLMSSINPEITGMAPVPLGLTGMRGGELNSRMMGLFAEIKDAAVRDAAWEYIRFIESDEANAIKTKIMVEGGFGPFLNPEHLRRYGYGELERLSPKGWADTFNISIETGKPEPYGKNSNVAYEMMTYPIQEAEQLARHDELPADPEKRLKVMQGLLRDANARANEMMIGIITPAERLKRRITAWLVLGGIVIGFSLVFRKIIKIFTPPASFAEQPRKSWDFRRYGWAYALLLPALLSIVTWKYLPLLRGSLMAFCDYRLLGRSTFVGVDNFGNLLFDSFWWQAIWNALRYSFLVLMLTFLPPIILAIALQEVPRGKLLFRLIYYLPAVISGLVTVLLWKQFYAPSERGALNALVLQIPAIGFVGVGLAFFLICFAFSRRLWLHEMRWQGWCFVGAGLLLFYTCASLAGPILFPAAETLATSLSRIPGRLFLVTPEAYNWLSDPRTSMLSCVIPMVWAGMGPGCLIYLAALKGIPNDYYEAADMDGATFIDKLLFVVFPMLKALVIINFVGAFINSWYSATGNILVMTGGGANTETAGLHIWYKAFTYLKFGPATAMAWMLGFLLIGFTVHQLRILSRVEFKAQGSTK
jgi:multiple sugar transport system permease protein